VVFITYYDTHVHAHALSWLIKINIGVAVPGYVLVIAESRVADWNRCGNYNSGGQCLHCVIELDNVR
jgi:hypothetical protein